MSRGYAVRVNGPELHRISLQNGKCFYCGISMNGTHPQKNSPTVDHVLPKSKNPNEVLKLSNFVIACFRCNTMKGSIPMEMFQEGYIEKKSYPGGVMKIRGPKRWYHGNIIKW